MKTWADICDESDDEEEIVPEEIVDIPLPGTGHVYSVPIHIGNLVIRTMGDLQYNIESIRQLFYKINESDPFLEELWAITVEDMTNTSDPETMDAAARDFALAYSNDDIVELPQNFRFDSDGFNLHAVTDALESEDFKNVMEEFSLEIMPKLGSVHVELPKEIAPTKNTILNEFKTNVPPLCPKIPESIPIKLRLSPEPSIPLPISVGHRDWTEVIKEYDNDFPDDCINTVTDIDEISGSHNNLRPANSGKVLIVYADGSEVNVGSHGFTLNSNHDYVLDFQTAQLALFELFSAPGGEGLTCPTPSMMLHQMVSAVLSMALSSYNPTVEQEFIDIFLESNSPPNYDHFIIDVGSSSGIWTKPLKHTLDNPKSKTQAIVSKYDLAAVIASACGGTVQKAFVRAVANSLHMEYPEVYRIDHTDAPLDLKLQAQIYQLLSNINSDTMVDLAEMCHEAAVAECVRKASSVNIHARGLEWKDKRDMFSAQILRRKVRGRIAVPPVPIGEITALPVKPFRITVSGQEFSTNSYELNKQGMGPSTHVTDQRKFLERYPTSGIVEEAEAYEIASLLDGPFPSQKGLTHKGPARDTEIFASDMGKICDCLYASSAMAQLAEIRSDVARAVMKLPFPSVGRWQQVFVYKGKVSVWYSSRDMPNSPKGYRIDWFAVSSFPVIGSRTIRTSTGGKVHLWPRQRLRSQEISLAHMGPRRLKLSLYSMLEKAKTAGASYEDVILAWNRLGLILNSSTYASGEMFLTARYLSSTISSPSSPFHEMAKKIPNPITFADIWYLHRLKKVMSEWSLRDDYKDKCPILGLPKQYAQLESYLMMWVPSEYADETKHMMNCALALKEEYDMIEKTMMRRTDDLMMQCRILQQPSITFDDLRKSLRSTCTLDTGGRLGWSWIGSLASAFALNGRAKAEHFDARYGRGRRARTIVNHLTVRHSFRINEAGKLETGTVAEMMLRQGIDVYLSTIDQTYRFLFINRPVFNNHPKKGEHKDREISIVDPDSRVLLSDAELICGMYGKTTGIDFLKDSAKNSKFYKNAARIMTKGGTIQSSDATRYGPMMSNFAIAIMLLYLGVDSTHLRWAGQIYARLAYRKMLLPTEIKPLLVKMSKHRDMDMKCSGALRWMNRMPVACTTDTGSMVWYCTSHHMGQGMSHHSSSLLHAGGLCVAVTTALQFKVIISSKRTDFNSHIMVTSDDSTILVEADCPNITTPLSRHEAQNCTKVFLQYLREARGVALRMVSVMPNLVKEVISSIKGEFNSQDTGIGSTCPMLGFRELVSLCVAPTSTSLIGDYLACHASARSVALTGQGVETACMFHHLMIDAVEERWSITEPEKNFLQSLAIVPQPLVVGCDTTELLCSPHSWFVGHASTFLYRQSMDHNSEKEEIDPNVRDTILAPLMHVRIGMARQHQRAIDTIKTREEWFRLNGMINQSLMLKDCLRSTLSSARGRNVGRIGFRIRHRNIEPDKYLGHKFEKGNLMEHTMNWLAHLDSKLKSFQPDPDDFTKVNSLFGYIAIKNQPRFGFPHPPELKRHSPARMPKPLYRLAPYGVTPFGKHAIDRSGAMIIPGYTTVEREALAYHRATQEYKKITEHVSYGESFIISWRTRSSGVLVAVDISGPPEDLRDFGVCFGDFGPDGVSKLKELARDYPDLPVLALHRHDGNRGIWHAIQGETPLTVSLSVDLSVDHGSAIYHQMSTGKYVLLALQGTIPDPDLVNTAPTASEVLHYQSLPHDFPMPELIVRLEEENMKHGTVKYVSAATVLDIKGVDTLLYFSNPIYSTYRDDEMMIPRAATLRAKMIASLAMAGYWHTALRGVCFRAFMKGHYYDETIWTGGVIGWRLYSNQVPMYYNPNYYHVAVRHLMVMEGIQDADQLAPYETSSWGKPNLSICGEHMLSYDAATEVQYEFIEAMIQHNGGQRYPVAPDTTNLFCSFQNPPLPSFRPMTKPQAERELRRLLARGATMTFW